MVRHKKGYSLISIPTTPEEWYEAVNAYRTWVLEQQEMRKKGALDAAQPPPLIDITWSLEDLEVLRSASKIELPQFLLLRVLFRAMPESLAKGHKNNKALLTELGVAPITAFSTAAQTLADDAPFQHLLGLIRRNRFLDQDITRAITMQGRFLLVRRHLDQLRRSQRDPIEPSASVIRVRVLAEAQDVSPHVFVYSTPKKAAPVAGLDSIWQSGDEGSVEVARGEGPVPWTDDDDGDGQGSDDEVAIGADMALQALEDLALDDYDPLEFGLTASHAGSADKGSVVLPPGSSPPRDNSELAFEQVTSDEAKCLICIVDLLNALYLPIIPDLEAIPEQRLFRILERVGSGERPARPREDLRSLLAAKADAIVGWRDEDGGNSCLLSIVEVKRKGGDTAPVRMQHAAEMVAWVADSTRTSATSSASRRYPQGPQRPESSPVVLIAQNCTEVWIRIGVYGAPFADQLHVKGSRTRSAAYGDSSGSFMHVYTLGKYDIFVADEFEELCEVLLGIGIASRDQRVEASTS